MSSREIIFSAAGAAGAPATYIEDVFSTWLYTGNSSTQIITNGIDLAGKGGLVWIKGRSTPSNHMWVDTARGNTKYIRSSTAGAELTYTDALTSFNSNGFTLGADVGNGDVNTSPNTQASWTFRKQPKFFDVQTFTATGSLQTISHSLGSTPGMMILKRTDGAASWIVYHRGLTYPNANAINNGITLNSTSAGYDYTGIWGTGPTSTNFQFDTTGLTGWNFVVYLFAHNAGGFGLTGTDNVISCGSFTTDGSGSATVSLGYEPQYLMFKASSTTQNWFVVDNMRGFSYSATLNLKPNTSGAEADFGPNAVTPTATGFVINAALSPSQTYIYMAIRRGPMKTPTSGTSVFDASVNNSSAVGTPITIGFPFDMQIQPIRTPFASQRLTYDRLRGLNSTTSSSVKSPTLFTNTTDAEDTANYTSSLYVTNTGFQVPNDQGPYQTVFWSFRRVPGFFDVVCYTGTGSATTVAHNLGVVPELMIVKTRSNTTGWYVYNSSIGNNNTLILDGNSGAFALAIWNNTTPTNSVFSLGSSVNVNGSGRTYVAYLFATVAGVSKVGTYTGTGSTQTINAGLPTGARFVLIKRTDSTGDWWVWDTARGMVSGTDPRLALNSTAAEINNDWVYTTTNGFQIVTTDATVNASGGSYIYLAVS